MSLYPCDTLPNPGDEQEEHVLVKRPIREPRCAAKTKHGTMCHKRSQPGRSLCHIHRTPVHSETHLCATCWANGHFNSVNLVTFFHVSGSDIKLCDTHFIEMCNSFWAK